MRRALLLLALLALPLVAEAKVAIVHDRTRNMTLPIGGYTTLPGDTQQWTDWTVNHVVGFLTRYGRESGTDYDVYSPEQVSTSLAAVGSIQGQTYTAVIWAGVETYTNANNPHVGCYPCSLTLIEYAPSVPQLHISNGSGENFYSVSTSCSLGTTGALDPNGQGPGLGDAVLFIPGQTMKWHRAWDVGQMPRATLHSGGWRTLIGVKEGPGFHDRDSTEGVTFTLNKYSVALAAYDTTTSIAWHVGAMLHSNKSGMSQNIFVRWGTSAVTRMGGPGADANAPNMNGDPFPIYFGLAYLDSLLGGGLLGTTDPEPVRFAIQVEGLAARANGQDHGGMMPHDTTAAYASLDSLDVLDVPIVFGVNSDSAGTYQRDINVAKAIGKARFTPWIRTGLDSAVAGGGNASYLQTRDLMGRYRNRSAFLRPFGTAAGDTSIRNLAQWARWRIDSIVGGGRFSGVIMAPDDDWSPKNITDFDGNRDSLVAGLVAAGYRGISFSVDADTLNKGAANPVGLTMPPMFVRNIHGDGEPFGFLAHTKVGRRPNSGPWVPVGGVSDSLVSAFAVRKLWMSAYTGQWFVPEKEAFTRAGRSQDYAELTAPTYTTGHTSPLADKNRPVNILRLSMAGLGSGRTGTSAPARAGFYAAKSLVNMVRALNHINGRTLATIVYPEDLQATDLR